MRNTELIANIYDRLPKSQPFKDYTIDQLFDRFTDIKDMIEAERPEIARNHLWKNKDNFWSGGHLEKK
jgi:hypothetical protein